MNMNKITAVPFIHTMKSEFSCKECPRSTALRLARCLARFWPILVETLKLKNVISLHIWKAPIWSFEKKEQWDGPNDDSLLSKKRLWQCPTHWNMESAPVAKVVVRFKDVVLFHSFSVLDMATSLRYRLPNEGESCWSLRKSSEVGSHDQIVHR